MGIKYLNRFLRDKCPESITHIEFSELTGKKIAIDISIYLYKYEATDSLLENIYLMLATFRHYNIIPVFIFDGKPPNEKKYILQERKKQKEKNKEKIKELTEILNNMSNETSTEEKKNILLNIDKLKRQTIFITREKIEEVKNIIRINGSTYYDAPQEADELCSILTIREQVWGCVSEDMDMFIYGCPRVIRYLNIFNKTAKLYDIKNILFELNVSFNNFKQTSISNLISIKRLNKSNKSPNL
jgi:flap endonuclease-1